MFRSPKSLHCDCGTKMKRWFSNLRLAERAINGVPGTQSCLPTGRHLACPHPKILLMSRFKKASVIRFGLFHFGGFFGNPSLQLLKQGTIAFVVMDGDSGEGRVFPEGPSGLDKNRVEFFLRPSSERYLLLKSRGVFHFFRLESDPDPEFLSTFLG